MKLPVSFPVGDEGLRFVARQWRLGRLIGGSKLLGALVRLRRPLDDWIRLGERYRADQKFAKLGTESPGYVGDKEVTAFLHYRGEVRSGRLEKLRSPSAAIYAEQKRLLTPLLENEPIRAVVNFGVSYAYIDALLAKAFPEVDFHGVDRAPETKVLNEIEFIGQRNLHFHAADVSDFFASHRLDGGLLLHSRTTTLIPADVIVRIYREAAAAGIRYIAGFEPVGLPRATMREFEFSLDERPSAHYRHFMFIHNYPNLLRQAGFELLHFDAIRTNNPHKDARILCFTARA